MLLSRFKRAVSMWSTTAVSSILYTNVSYCTLLSTHGPGVFSNWCFPSTLSVEWWDGHLS